MQFDVITTQPDIYDSFLKTGLIGRGISREIIKIDVHTLHDFSFDAHRSIDDTPAGGGPGMVIEALPIIRAIEAAQKNCKNGKACCHSQTEGEEDVS